MSIVIVAIPEKDDLVWKVSSEKIPHLTLLYMEGPLRNEEHTLQFVQHVALTSFRKFGLSVDRRDTLGPDDADVLFFDREFTKDLITARSHLLTNTSIAEAYRRAEQWPKWTPHLTLGYPETPAKPNPNDHGIHWVNFDRIAVWFGDSEGPEFRLKSEENMALDTYHADLDNLSDEFIAHFSLKKMVSGAWKKAKSIADDVGDALDSTAGAVSDVADDASDAVGKASSKFDESSVVRDAKGRFAEAGSVVGDLVDKVVTEAAQPFRETEVWAEGYKDFYRDHEGNLRPKSQGARDDNFNPKAKLDTTQVEEGKKAPGLPKNSSEAAERARKNKKNRDNPLDDYGPPVDLNPNKKKVKHSDSKDDELRQSALDDFHDALDETFLEHFGVKGMRWGVRKDERPLDRNDIALNLAQRQQVKIANTISTLASVGLATNAAAAGFQLQNRWENLQVVRTLIEQAENNPLLSDATREGLRVTKNKVVRGLVASAAATTAVTFAIGALATRSAQAYFAPLHKSYKDVKPQINGELRKLSKDIKKGNRPKMTVKEYNDEVSKIVSRNLTADRNNLLYPFHELARSQLGTEYDTKSLKIKFEKLPNTDLYNKMTVVTPNGLKLVKAIKKVEHADDDAEIGEVDFYFDYKFDSDGFVEEWSSPTIEIANLMFEDQFDLDDISTRYGGSDKVVEQNALDDLDDFLEHFGVKGMRWGVRRRTGPDGLVTGSVDQAIREGQAPRTGSSAPVTRGKQSSDHQAMQDNLKKQLDELTTAEIREITNRIKAVNDFKATTAAEQAKKASVRKKLVDFALNSVQAGVKKAADEYIQEVTGDILKDVLPKSKTQLAKDKKQREADEDRAQKKKDRAEKEAREYIKSRKEKDPSYDRAVSDLVDTLTKKPETEESIGRAVSDLVNGTTKKPKKEE